MIKKAIERLAYLSETLPALLSQIDEADLSLKPSPKAWSKKEILGHLIDSATNNHQRFVRVQFEDTPFISYDSDKWVSHTYYSSFSATQLISFWSAYNKQLAALLTHLPEKLYSRTCKVGEQKTVRLDFLITDYVEHLEHHLKQIVNYQSL